MSSGLFILSFVAILGYGLAAGVFFAFSTFVMLALKRLPARDGIKAMQAINVAAINPLFMTALFGTAIACLAAAVIAMVEWERSYSPYVIAAAILCVLGTIGVTVACNVPRNDALAKIDAEFREAETYWRRYAGEWTAWNHVRTAASLIAMGLGIGAM